MELDMIELRKQLGLDKLDQVVNSINDAQEAERKAKEEAIEKALKDVTNAVSLVNDAVKKYENKLPKQEEGEEFKKINIDEVLAFYCTVLGGLDFDYNTVSYTKVMALQKQVTEKIKAIEESNRKN
jgi:hypothetical protein